MSNMANVSEIVFTTKGLPVTDELLHLAHMVEDACACKTQVSFSFDHALRIAVDVRTLEEVHIVESILPQLAGGVPEHHALGHAPPRLPQARDRNGQPLSRILALWP
jgi:hypothetical protein